MAKDTPLIILDMLVSHIISNANSFSLKNLATNTPFSSAFKNTATPRPTAGQIIAQAKPKSNSPQSLVQAVVCYRAG